MTNQITPLIATIKKQLKIRGLNYCDLATHLAVSEVTVKRIFSQHSISLKRLEKICELLDMTFLQLVNQANHSANNQPSVLSHIQERELAEHPLLLVYFYLIINGWSAASIEKQYNVGKIEGIKLLTTLDKLRLIELLPSNRVRLLTSRYINWLPNGPVRKLHEAHVKTEFLKANFNKENECFQFQFGELSMASREIITRKLKKLTTEFHELVDLDLNLPPNQKFSVGFLAATRPWVFSLIRQYKSDE